MVTTSARLALQRTTFVKGGGCWCAPRGGSGRVRLSPLEGVFEASVAPDYLAPDDEGGRAEDPHATGDVGLGVVSGPDLLGVGPGDRGLRVPTKGREDRVEVFGVPWRLVLQEPRAVCGLRVLRAPALDRRENADPVG